MNSREKCYFCFQNHKIKNCKAFISLKISERKFIVKKLKICFSCLEKHKNNICFYTSCNVCNREHNTVLCSLFEI